MSCKPRIVVSDIGAPPTYPINSFRATTFIQRPKSNMKSLFLIVAIAASAFAAPAPAPQRKSPRRSTSK
jgi:hypothetical protein